jgi:hypothetical protein
MVKKFEIWRLVGLDESAYKVWMNALPGLALAVTRACAVNSTLAPAGATTCVPFGKANVTPPVLDVARENVRLSVPLFVSLN